MPRYVSPLRDAQAAQTRRAVLAAAADLFAARGFGATSLGQIAERAGVSVETVKQHGPKSALLLGAFEQAFSGEAGEGPIHQRESGAQLASAPTERLPEAIVDFIADANARVARLWPRLLDTAAGDASFAPRLEALQEGRRSDFLQVIALLRERGLCLSEEPDAALAAALSFLVSPESYSQLVLESGWCEETYRAWLVRAMRALVLAP